MAGNFIQYMIEIHLACPEKQSRDVRERKDGSGTGAMFRV